MNSLNSEGPATAKPGKYVKCAFALLLSSILAFSFCSCSILEVFISGVPQNETRTETGSYFEEKHDPLIIWIEKGAGNESHTMNTVLKRLAKRYNEADLGEVEFIELERENDKPVFMSEQEAKPTDIYIMMSDGNRGEGINDVYSYLMANKKLENIAVDLLLDERYRKEDFIQPVMNACKDNGGQYAIPIYFTYNIISGYNNSAKKTGAPSKDGLTYDAFWDKMKAAADWSVANNVKFSPSDDGMVDISLLASDGAQLFNFRTLELHEEKKGGIAKISAFLGSLKYPDGDVVINKTPLDSIRQKLADMEYVLFSREVGNATYLLNEIVYSDKHSSYFLISPPTLSGKGHGAIVKSAIGVSAESDKKDEAYEFLSWCLFQEEFFKMQYSSVYEEAFPTLASPVMEQCVSAVKANKDSPITSLTLYNEITDISGAFMQSDLYYHCLLGAEASENTVDDIAEELRKQLARWSNESESIK